jgi:hypothetical protein
VACGLRTQSLLALVIVVVLDGCASSTKIALEPGASLSGYRVFEVEKVSNDTGQTFSFDVANFFSDELRSALQAKGYEVEAHEQPATQTLIVQCSITSYSPTTPGSKAATIALGLVPGGYFIAPKDSTTVKAILIDQRTRKTVADIVSNQSETESGIMPPMSMGYGHGVSFISTEKLVLREAAWGLASKIDEKIK